MQEERKPVVGSVFGVIFFALMAIGAMGIVEQGIEGELRVWSYVLLAVAPVTWLVKLHRSRRRRRGSED